MMLAAGPAAAEPVPAYSLETVARVPTVQLAEQLLPPAEAADVESHDVLDGGMIQFLAGVRFYHRPRPVAADLCVRRVQHVSFASSGAVAPDISPRQRMAEAGPVSERVEIAIAPDCRLAPGQRFVTFNRPISLRIAAEALRTVAALQADARAPGELTFSFTCSDELGQGACGGDGRAALAGLRTEQVWLIEADRHSPGWVRVTVGEPGQLYWELRFATGEAPTDLVMTRRIPAPF